MLKGVFFFYYLRASSNKNLSDGGGLARARALDPSCLRRNSVRDMGKTQENGELGFI